MEQRMYETRVNNIDDVNLRLVDVCVWSAQHSIIQGFIQTPQGGGVITPQFSCDIPPQTI